MTLSNINEKKGLFMGKTILRRTLNLFVMFAIIILFLACFDAVQFNEQNDNKVRVSFAIADSSVRTVFPQVSLDEAAAFKLMGGINGAAETELAEFSTAGTSVLLESGTWNFTLNAYDSSGKHILQGKVQARYISGPNIPGNVVTFSLSAINNGTGSIQITFNFPEEALITRISVSGDIDSEDFFINNNGEFIYINEQIASGDYFINFSLYSGNILRAVISELVLVRNYFTSSKIITLAGEDLKRILSGTISISQNTHVIVGTELTAIYSGEEIVTWQWNRDGSPIPSATSANFIPDSVGSYTVTANAQTYVSKTSHAIAVIGLPSSLPGTTLSGNLFWISNLVESYGNYVIDISDDETIPSFNLFYSGKSNIYITLISTSAPRTISLSSGNTMFTVGSGVTLILDNNITLQGISGGSSSLINITGGSLVMNNGAAITRGRVIVSSNSKFTMDGGNISNYDILSSISINGGAVSISGGNFIMNNGNIFDNNITLDSSNNIYGYGGGVHMSGGTFTMNGGNISNNSILTTRNHNNFAFGGGVYMSGGTFIMNDGNISGNNNNYNVNTRLYYINGSGVYMAGGSFTMNGGNINDNNCPSLYSHGGGVYISYGIFTMNGGYISENNDSTSGGGIHMSNGTFTMYDGFISHNTANNGGGVYIGHGTFTMYDGFISHNTANQNGGGVYGSFNFHNGIISNNTATNGGGIFVNDSFTMFNGTISDNTSSQYGGGVYIPQTSTFTKTGGTIYGYTNGVVNSNAVKDINGIVQSNRGHAVSVLYDIISIRKETDAGPEVNLSWNGTVNPPTISGAWDY
ncbi:MAG: hypothetical protein FWD40_11640 [Treponema sp.]|nr:hypothetical protein [Treponema sp.]